MDRRHRGETLTQELMRERVHDILALEELFYRQFGMSYSHEVWTENILSIRCQGSGNWAKSPLTRTTR